MSRNLLLSSLSAAALCLTSATLAYAGDAKSDKYVWTPPTNITQALNIRLETKATEELLKKAIAQCIDDDCKKQVEACRKTIATCVLVPSKASVHESEVENN